MRTIKVYDRQEIDGRFHKMDSYRTYTIDVGDISTARRVAFCYHYDVKSCPLKESWIFTEEVVVRHITNDFIKHVDLNIK